VARGGLRPLVMSAPTETLEALLLAAYPVASLSNSEPSLTVAPVPRSVAKALRGWGPRCNPRFARDPSPHLPVGQSCNSPASKDFVKHARVAKQHSLQA
jgi:hypothetical protein